MKERAVKSAPPPSERAPLPQSPPVTLLLAFIDAQRWRPRASRRGWMLIRLFPLVTGGCEGCAMEVEALPSVTALEGSGFQLVADPREADWLLLTGPVTRASAGRLAEAWNAMPPGRSLIALGACAADGGPFSENYAVLGGITALSRQWRFIPGCPPAPNDILYALTAFASGAESVLAEPLPDSP